jgi:hypothetical protein
MEVRLRAFVLGGSAAVVLEPDDRRVGVVWYPLPVAVGSYQVHPDPTFVINRGFRVWGTAPVEVWGEMARQQWSALGDTSEALVAEYFEGRGAGER